MKDPEENINHQKDISLEIETCIETILYIVPETHKTEIEGCQEDLIGLEINPETIQVIDQMIEQEKVEMILNKKSNRHCDYCNQDGHTWKYCWKMQANAKKARRLKEMDDRDDDPTDTFNSMVSEDPISDDDHVGFNTHFSEMIELNKITIPCALQEIQQIVQSLMGMNVEIYINL